MQLYYFMHTDEVVGKSVQRFLKNCEFFERKAIRQNRVPNSLSHWNEYNMRLLQISDTFNF